MTHHEFDKSIFIGGTWSHYEGAALNKYYEWLLAEARWEAEYLRQEFVDWEWPFGWDDETRTDRPYHRYKEQ